VGRFERSKPLQMVMRSTPSLRRGQILAAMTSHESKSAADHRALDGT
jgi:hypothetical protein